MSLHPFTIQNHTGKQIKSVDDWFRFAPPKQGSKHWVDGRSAKELAKAWFRTGVAKIPNELQALLDSRAVTQGFVPDLAVAELVTSLDGFGEGRNHDLVIVGHVESGKLLVAVEAKADESFGNLIDDCLAHAKPPSRVPDRIDHLSRSVFGRPVDRQLGKLRYQLLHGLAGTLIEASNRHAKQAVFVVHEFITDKVTADKVAQNAADLQNFIQAFPGHENVAISPGILIDGIQIRDGRFVLADIPVLIGKVTTQLTGVQ